METKKIIEFINYYNEFTKESTSSATISFNVDRNTLLKLALELNMRVNAPSESIKDYWCIIKSEKISIIFSYKHEEIDPYYIDLNNKNLIV